ncbi:hypothetical protein ANANG_G00185190 [Anguilla anguilla]|uniref:Uncharacterized protein n=1 Tax=Anguilla anguilla TaxID=7936 RepID=A0A9D3MCF4_ANGAN|nr:hypothetical protein ANANG_G00185190 [Anguilla anguilla]
MTLQPLSRLDLFFFLPRGERESLVREDGFYFEIPQKIKYSRPTALEGTCLILGAADEAIGGGASRDRGANVILGGCQDPVSL